MRSLPLLCLAPLLAAPLAAQDVHPCIERLIAGPDRSRALAELHRLGPPATAAVAAALTTADAATASILAQALAELPGSAAAVPPLLARIPRAGIDERDALLHALGTCVPTVDDDLLATIAAARRQWAAAGLFYSPSPQQPTFAWYEYVRLGRRLQLCRRGLAHDDLAAALAAIRAERASLCGQFAGLLGKQPDDPVCNLAAFGQHGTREQLEVLAELVLAKAARDLAPELFEYLRHEPPRPAEILTEHCAGIGDDAPDHAAAVQFPTRWRRDDWRLACARAVHALDADPAHRQFALRHLLRAPSASERLDAIVAVRAAPPPWTPFAAELAADLDDAERMVVREALITLGLAEAATRAAVPAATLQRLAQGSDRELATLARRLRR